VQYKSTFSGCETTVDSIFRACRSILFKTSSRFLLAKMYLTHLTATVLVHSIFGCEYIFVPFSFILRLFALFFFVGEEVRLHGRLHPGGHARGAKHSYTAKWWSND